MAAPDNVHTLRSYQVPLCVECLACGHRALLQPDALVRTSNVGDMISLVAVSRKLKCRSCGSRATKSFKPESEAKAKAFLRGA